jgi:hypothetical protein
MAVKGEKGEKGMVGCSSWRVCDVNVEKEVVPQPWRKRRKSRSCDVDALLGMCLVQDCRFGVVGFGVEG